MNTSTLNDEQREAMSGKISMLRFAKTCGWLAICVAMVQSALGYSTVGPFEAYQVPVIGYNLPGDIDAPKNVGEGFRWNTPTVYYAFDPSFLDYFGSNGVYAVEQAIGVLNAYTNFSLYTTELSEFPLESTRVNYRAESLQLFDLKTVTLEMLVEELGLTDPERYVFTLRDRRVQPTLACPFMIYDVIQRNYDPVSFMYSPYINFTLFTYAIQETCTGPNPLGVTVNFPVDPTAQEGTALEAGSRLDFGAFTTGLSRDDFGGLRYLLRTNQVQWESLSSDSVQFVTNQQPILVTSSNLTLLAQAALTNDAPTLQGLFPGLTVTSSSNWWAVVWVTNVTSYFTNYPWDVAGDLPHLVFATNVTPTIQTIYHHTFGNLNVVQRSGNNWTVTPATEITNFVGHWLVQFQNTVVAPAPYSDPINPVSLTNIFTRNFASNGIVGEYLIFPTNACGVTILSALLTNTVVITNLITAANTNAPVTSTNIFGGTNGTAVLAFSQTRVDYFTNHTFIVQTADCNTTNTATLRQGMDHLPRFVRTSFDSLIGRFYQPVTNFYTSVEITNSQYQTDFFERVVVAPDVLFQTGDLLENQALRSVPTFSTNALTGGAAGPGTIAPNITITYNRINPLLINFFTTNSFANGLSQAEGTTNFIWGSFDGTTNDPVIYPSGTSLASLENMIVFQILTATLPSATVGTAYAAQLQVTGGQPPYTWAPSAGSSPLPGGLTLTAGGTVSGTPTAFGTFSFNVTVTESGGRSTSRTITLTVSP